LQSARRGYEAFQEQPAIVGITPKITEVIIVRKRISVTYEDGQLIKMVSPRMEITFSVSFVKD